MGCASDTGRRLTGATLIANPGCYATAALLGLIPALATGVIAPDVIIDAKSGVSGAGQSLTLGTHYAEVNEDVSAYSLSGHRHLPEITQELEAAAVRRWSPCQPIAPCYIYPSPHPDDSRHLGDLLC